MARSLPADNARELFIQLVKENQVVIVVAETGAGMTTRLTTFLAEMPELRKNKGVIVVTQPRPLAAISNSHTVAESLNETVGHGVGYDVRYDAKWIAGETYIKCMTDGALLRDVLNDPFLRNVSAVVLDEVHERTVATDTLLVLLKRMRPNFKLIIMSATLHAEEFAQYFLAPIVDIEGRQYGVETFHLNRPAASYIDATVETCMRIHCSAEPGDVLVFLPGTPEIHTVIDLFKLAIGKNAPVELFPLYAQMSREEQQIALADPIAVSGGLRKRRYIFATNIAEASLTVLGIRYVIDCGYSKQKKYFPQDKVEALNTLPISQSSTRQRQGRAGRMSDGFCYRLYPKECYYLMQEQTDPHILHENLAGSLLNLIQGRRNPRNFEWLAMPSMMALEQAFGQLLELDAIDVDDKITPLGRHMSGLTLEPPFAKAVVQSITEGVVDEVVTLAAIISTGFILQVPKAPPEAIIDARNRHAQWQHEDGEIFILIGAFRSFNATPEDYQKEYCKENYLAYSALLEVSKLRQQLLGYVRDVIARRLDITPNLTPQNLYSRAVSRNVRRSLTSGLFNNVMYRHLDKQWLLLNSDRPVEISSSGKCHNHLDLAMFTNLTAGDRNVYANNTFVISCRWLYEFAGEHMHPRYYQPGALQFLEMKQAELLQEPDSESEWEEEADEIEE